METAISAKQGRMRHQLISFAESRLLGRRSMRPLRLMHFRVGAPHLWS